MTLPHIIPGKSGGILLVCDHASNAVPDGIDLGIAPDLLEKHIAIDIGTAGLTETLAAELRVPALLATLSRLVIDLNRPTDHPGLIPQTSDGHAIPGNATADRTDRIARFHAPYHAALAGLIVAKQPVLIAAIHSFTPRLEHGDGAPRPWEIGILSNTDRRAADLALPQLAAQGLVTGDNEPYSGQLLNATLDRHGEGNDIPSLSIEIRNDLIAEPAGVQRWTAILAPILRDISNRLAPGDLPTQ